jgi:hypothetical protein
MPDHPAERRRALEMLAGSPEGLTDAALLAHGFARGLLKLQSPAPVIALGSLGHDLRRAEPRYRTCHRRRQVDGPAEDHLLRTGERSVTVEQLPSPALLPVPTA